jgi:uncharacterized protein YjbI with pentapeptide repeats
MKKISKEELNEMLVKHELWLKNEGGEQLNLENVDLSDANLSDANLRNANLRNANLNNANLRNADLEYADLINANLGYADLRNTDLRNTDLEYADLEYADLENANLINANLRKANLEYANLNNANLGYADLECADLRNANLSCANLRYTDLRNADLINADLEYVETNHSTIGYHLACPEEGSFIGYKKANGCLVKLLILEDSKRSSATSMKCRCDKAKVLDIIDLMTNEKIDRTKSDYDNEFFYEVGEIVQVDDFDEDRWNECATGIHFFMNKENAIKY